MKEVKYISIDLIKANRNQPRLDFDQESLLELAQSIRENGLIQPIVVREVAEGYEIIAGERRYRASIMAGYTELPVIVKDATELESAKMALVENIQRENLTAIEEAKAFNALIQEHGLTQGDIANKIGKSQPAVANKLRLLNLAEPVQEAVSQRAISERHARALLAVNELQQIEILKRIIDKKLNVNQTEEYIKSLQVMQTKKEKPVTKAYSRNQKVAVNTIYQAITMIKKMGIEVETEEISSEEDIQLIIKLPL